MTRQRAHSPIGRGEAGPGLRQAARRLAVALVLVGAWASVAAAEVEDGIVFVRGDALWRVPGEGQAEPVQVASLGAETVTGLVASPAGDAVLVELGERVAWAPLTGASRSLRMLDCSPPARFSPDGRYVSCARRAAGSEDKPGADARPGAAPAPSTAPTIVYALPDQQRSQIAVPAAQVVGFINGSRLVMTDDKGIWAVPTEPGAPRALLASHRPSGPVLISPHGRRAVGVFPPVRNHKSPGLYVFRLDGKAVRRRLLPDAIPVAWSRDDRWVAVQTEKSACLVRATGGQYKCWKRFQALSISPAGRYLLLGKPSEKEGHMDLFRGERDGVRPAAPRPVARDVTGPAVWIPACATCR